MLRLRAARHRHVRPAPAFSANLLSHHVHQIPRFDFVDQIGCHTGNQTDLAFGYCCQNDSDGFEFILELVQCFPQRRSIRAFQQRGQYLNAVAIHRLTDEIIALCTGQFRFEPGQFLFHCLSVIDNLQDARGSFLRLGLNSVCNLLQLPLLFLHIGQRALPGHRLDAPHAGRDTALSHDFEQSDVSGAFHMCAAAQFARCTDVEHAHLVAIFLAEQHHRAGLLRFLDAHQTCQGRCIGENLGIHDGFHFHDFRIGHRPGVCEVEACLVRVDQRTLLLHMAAQYFA